MKPVSVQRLIETNSSREIMDQFFNFFSLDWLPGLNSGRGFLQAEAEDDEERPD